MKTVLPAAFHRLGAELAKYKPDPEEVARQAMDIYLAALSELKLKPEEVKEIAQQTDFVVAFHHLGAELAKYTLEPLEVARRAMEIYRVAISKLKLRPEEVKAITQQMGFPIVLGGGIRPLPPFGRSSSNNK